MTRRIFVGLSGPTFFDYQNVARKARNDQYSSPNPILENALGLTIFYDEIWFLCESLCPQTLRGHPKIIYLDQYLSQCAQTGLKDIVASSIARPIEIDDKGVLGVDQGNFDNYWEKVKEAGAYWWNEAGRAVDNHTHGLRLLGVSTSANSNLLQTLAVDVTICERLRGTLGLSLALNSFTRNFYNALYPNQFDPVVAAGDQVICSSAVINALVPNCITPFGPQPEIFDRISNSAHVTEFRRYIQDRQVNEAYTCYLDLVHEINDSIVREVKKSADRLHPTRGIASIIIDAIQDALGIGLLTKVGTWYAGAVAPQPIAAAAFILDVNPGTLKFK